MSGQEFKPGDFVERQCYRYQIIGINAEGNLVCFDQHREYPQTFHKTACRLIPGCKSFDDSFPAPVPDCGDGWRLLRKGARPEPVIKGDEFWKDKWFESLSWCRTGAKQDLGMWYRRRTDAEPAEPAEPQSEWRDLIHEEVMRENDEGSLDGLVWYPVHKSCVGKKWLESMAPVRRRVVKPVDLSSDDVFEHMASVFRATLRERIKEVFPGVTLPPGTLIVFGSAADQPAWQSGVGVDVVSRENAE